MTSSERSAEVKVVVFLADLDPAYNNYTAGVLLAQYGEHVTSGLMTILRVLPDYYPRLVGLHRNFGDSVSRTINTRYVDPGVSNVTLENANYQLTSVSGSMNIRTKVIQILSPILAAVIKSESIYSVAADRT